MSANVRELAQTDPVANLAHRAGELAHELRDILDHLTAALRTLDRAQEQLAERGIVFEVDLGPIGNAAQAARRDLEKERPTAFKMPSTRINTR